jgi:hypothetical protein
MFARLRLTNVRLQLPKNAGFRSIANSNGKAFGKGSICFNYTRDLIMERSQNINFENHATLYNEFTDNSRHFNDDTFVDLTPLMDKHKIMAAELLLYMNNTVYYKWSGSKYLEDSRINGLFAAQDIIREDNKVMKVGDIIIGSTFRRSTNEEQVVDIGTYDGSHGKGQFYTVLLSLLDLKLQHGESSIRNPETKCIIMDQCKEINPENYYELYTEFISNSVHKSFDTIVDITKLMDRYNITGHELFYEMYTNSSPFGMGNLVYKDEEGKEFNVRKAKKILKENHYTIDYYNGNPIKNSFRMSHGERQIIHMKKYDDRTHKACFYACILKLLNQKIKIQTE